MSNMHWLLQVAALVLGMFYMPLGVALILLDGWFHLRSDQATLERDSPDWIIARQWGGTRLPEWVHKLMGAVLVLSSIAVIHVLGAKKTPRTRRALQLYRQVLMPVTLAIIALAITLKGIAQQPGQVAFF